MTPDEQLKYLKEAERLELELARLKSGNPWNRDQLIEATTRQLDRVDNALMSATKTAPTETMGTAPRPIEWAGTRRAWGEWILEAYNSGHMPQATSGFHAIELATQHWVWKDPDKPESPAEPFKPKSVYQNLKNKADYQNPKKPGPR